VTAAGPAAQVAAPDLHEDQLHTLMLAFVRQAGGEDDL